MKTLFINLILSKLPNLHTLAHALAKLGLNHVDFIYDNDIPTSEISSSETHHYVNISETEDENW